MRGLSEHEPCYFVFDQFELDTPQRQLRHDGHAVELQPKAFDTLHYLVAHHARTVSREELLAEVWAGDVVCTGALNQCLYLVRKALRLGPNGAQAIRTVHGRGYRFTRLVKALESAVPQPLPLPDGDWRRKLYGPQLSVLDGLLQRRSSTAAGSLIMGAPRMGKTWLLDQAASMAATRGWVVVSGACSPPPSRNVFAPWIEGLLGVAQDPRLDDSYLGALDVRLAGLCDVTLGAGDGALGTQVEAVSAWVRDVAKDRPVLVLIDDVHLADEPSVRTLLRCMQLQSLGRIVCVAGLRTLSHEPCELARRFLDQTGAHAVTLRPMVVDALGEILEAWAGCPAQPSVVREVFELTGGHPHLLECFAPHWVAWSGQFEAWSISNEARQGRLRAQLAKAAQEVLAPLSGDAMRLLRSAADLTEPCGTSEVHLRSGLAHTAWHHAWHEALHAGVLRRVGDAHFVFSAKPLRSTVRSLC